MELYFLRHAIAADTGPTGAGDAGRPLTHEGIARMRLAARGLRRLAVRLDALLSSPLVRAHQTAEIVARELGIELRLIEQLSPGCNVELLRNMLRDLPRCDRVMLVGHEPDFSQMVGELSGGSHVLLKKGALARVDLEAPEDSSGTLVWLIQPATLRELGK